MDFDLAGLLANPDFQYMLAGIGAAGGAASGNPFAQAVGGITQQGITAENQKKLIMALLGQGGGSKGYDKVSKQFLGADPATKISSDGKTATFTGPVGAFEGFGGGTPTPQPNPQAGGQPGIINPSGGLPGDLSGLSLAGLKPEDINKAITLGLTSSDLERKRVSDLYQNQYWQALVEERRAMRGAKDVSAPVGDGLSLAQFNAYPSDVKAHLYANHLRKQSGQAPISFEQFKLQSDSNSTMQLIDRANRDPAFKKGLMEYKQAGATQINLPGDAAKQQQREAISNFNTLKDPKFKGFDIPEDDQYALATQHNTWIGDPKFAPILTKAKINKILGLIKGTGATVHEKDVKIEGNEIVIPVTTATGAKDVIRRTIR